MAGAAGQDPRRGGGQPQRGGVDVAGDDGERTDPAHRHREALAQEVREVEAQQQRDQPEVVVQRVVAGRPEQPDDQQHVAEQLPYGDVEADLAEGRDEAGLTLVQIEVEPEARRGGGDQRRHVRHERAQELDGEGRHQRGER